MIDIREYASEHLQNNARAELNILKLRELTPCPDCKRHPYFIKSGDGLTVSLACSCYSTNPQPRTRFAVEEWELDRNNQNSGKIFFRSNYILGDIGYIKLSDNTYCRMNKEPYEMVKHFSWTIAVSTYGVKTILSSSQEIKNPFILKNVISGMNRVVEIDGDFRNLLNENLKKQSVIEMNLLRPPRNGNKYKGVIKENGARGFYYAKLSVNKTSYSLGAYPTKEEAAAMVDAGKRFYFKGCNFWENCPGECAELPEHIKEKLKNLPPFE